MKQPQQTNISQNSQHPYSKTKPKSRSNRPYKQAQQIWNTQNHKWKNDREFTSESDGTKKKMLYDDEILGFLMGGETNREIKRRAAPASFPYYRGS